MLDNLYKKLYIIFISSIMLVITAIIGVLCTNSIDNKQRNDSIFFQRLSMLMIYELENPKNNPQMVIKPYEHNYSIYALLTDTQGDVIYQSNSLFPTDINLLLKNFSKESNMGAATSLNQTSATTQSGIVSFSGVSHDTYWGIPAMIVDKNGTVFHLRLLHQKETAFELIKKQLPFCIVIWFVSLLGVTIISHFLLRYAMKPTEKVLKSQKDFIAAASHELKAPLAVILANNDKINDLSRNLPDIQKASHVIDTELLHVSKLIKDMLFLASSDAGTRTINKTKVNLDTLLITLYEAYEPLCSQKGIFLDADFMESHFPVLYTDPECVFQILSIFMDNAIVHSKTETSIKIKAALSRSSLTISVIDYGCGVSEKDKPYIFDRFYCADKSHTDKSHFGLGLSIAKELAQSLSAEIGLMDTKNGGATFFLILQKNESLQ
ncbi:MAG: HAMP domain-containing histidine kinase [Lachnospiraceae bacterium]|nr:HAMP domain-containing histidine kinase [Lachnospiraceae bacterium]